MEAWLVGVVVLVSAAATGVFLWTVWRFVLMPSLEGVPGVRRAVVFLAILTPGIAPFAIVLFDLSDRQAFLVIAVVTYLAIGIGILALRSRRGRMTAVQDEDHK